MSSAWGKTALPICFCFGFAFGCLAVSTVNSYLYQYPKLYRKKGGRRSGIRTSTEELSRKAISNDVTLLILVQHFLDVIERDILPLAATSVCSSKNNCTSGGAILSNGNYEVVVAAVNQEDVSPLFHSSIACLLEYSQLNRNMRSAIQTTTLLLTHEPCRYCLSSVALANISTCYYVFRRGPSNGTGKGCSTEDSEIACSQCDGCLRPSDLRLFCLEDIVRDLMSKRNPGEPADVASSSAQDTAKAAHADRLLLLSAQRLSAFAKVFSRLEEERTSSGV